VGASNLAARELQGDADRDRPVWLPPMIPGGTSTTTLTVRNDADVPMHFLWKQYVPPPPPPPDADGLPGVAPSPTRVNVRHRPTNKNNQVQYHTKVAVVFPCDAVNTHAHIHHHHHHAASWDASWVTERSLLTHRRNGERRLGERLLTNTAQTPLR
jgi:hypothetical protein